MRNDETRADPAQHPPTTDRVTRRNFCLRTAAAAAAVAAPVVASAQDPRLVLDVAVLNFLLRVGYVHAELYREALGDLRPSAFDPFGSGTFATLTDFGNQKAAHVETLRDLVTRAGGTPLPACNVSFTRFRTAPEFFEVALALENIGVSAYLGVLPLVRHPQLLSAVASISSVQSRHAAFIGMLNGQPPAPAPADTPRSRGEILGLLDPYIIGSCSA